jgi:hypothetical protein
MASVITVSLDAGRASIATLIHVLITLLGNAYYDMFPNLAEAGIEVRSFDQRYVHWR